MNENEFDTAARAWLDDGPMRMSDHALLSALDEIHTTRQRRAPWQAWRASPMSMFARVAVAAVLVAGVGLLAINLIPRPRSAPSVAAPSRPSPTIPASPSPSPSPAPSGSPAEVFEIPALTVPFVSSTNGFSATHPKRSSMSVATGRWSPPQPLADGGRLRSSLFDWKETATPPRSSPLRRRSPTASRSTTGSTSRLRPRP